MVAITVMTGTAACASTVARSPATPSTVITPIAIAAPMPALTTTVGQPAATVPTTRAAATPADAARTDDPVPANTIFELQQRMQTHELSELRITYSGAYGASLLFAQSGLTYYVMLFRQRDLWRVIRATNEVSAEHLHSDFAKQAQTMADLELQCIRLEAQKERSERQVATQQEKLHGPKIDLDIQRQQQAQMQERQKIAHTEAEVLDAERRAARAHVDELQRQIRELEAQVNAPFNS